MAERGVALSLCTPPPSLSVGAAEASSFTCMAVQGSRLPVPNPPLPPAFQPGFGPFSGVLTATEYQSLSPTTSPQQLKSKIATYSAFRSLSGFPPMAISVVGVSEFLPGNGKVGKFGTSLLE